MAADQELSLGPTPPASGDGAEGRHAVGDGGDDSVKASRLPRWTRQEILVLIQGKRVAENRVRRGRGIGLGSGQVEPKWASVSSYCRRHGVNRGPVQCRKRWSNLSGDYKKIKEWELQMKDASESFWVMRSDLRRVRRLPGFFDREVYDILDQGTTSNAPLPVLALALAPAAVEVEEEEDDADGKDADEVVFDSGRSVAAEEGLFSDFEQDDDGRRSSPKREPEATPAQISGQRLEEAIRGDQGYTVRQSLRTSNEKQQVEPNIEMGSTSQEQDGRKRKRPRVDSGDEDTAVGDLQQRLIDALERNRRLVAEQLEAQNNHLRMDRDQRRDQASGFLAVLDKLAGAIGKIADKL